MQSQKKISLFEKVNISHNKLDDKLLNKSDQNILITKKSPSPRGRIRAYKNKYNTPEISRLKQTDKNKVVLDIKQIKNKNDSLTNKNEEALNNKIIYVQNSIETLNSQNISRKILLREKMFDINDIDENIRLTDVNLANNKLNYNQNLNSDKNADNFKQINDNNNFKEEKILRKSNSLNDFHLSNKQHLHIIDNFQKINREENYKLIKINFPKDNIIKSNSIEIIPGKFELLNSNHNNNLIRTNSDRHIINQENIIINNGFVNMNNNYYVNNNNLNNNINKINDNNDFVNNNINNIKFNNINYKNDIMFNTRNYYDSKIIDLNAINKHSNNLFNMNYNNINNFNNSEKVYINPKFLNKLNEKPKYNLNYNNNELNPIFKSKDISEEENSINETKEGNFNLEEDNFEPAFINNNFSLGNKSPQSTNFNKKLINNFSRNENKFRLIPNPQYFHPSFHPNIPFQYISILKIQYPIQMMVKKSKKLQLIKNKLISYYPPKIQLEMRPCLIFQPLIPKKKKKQHKKIPNNKKSSHKKIKHKRPVFKIPPCKKVSLSQGKSLDFIHKYYDENFILEEEDEEENKALKDLLLTHKQSEVTNDFNNDNENENKINKNEKPDVKEEKIDNVISDNNNNIINNEIKETNKKEEKEKNESINKNNENKKINEEKKTITKQRYINRMKIPINNENLNKKNKGNKVKLINIKKQKKSPIKEIMDHKKIINNIFSLNEVQQRFILNNSTRLNSTSVSIEKSKDNTLNKKSKSKSKIANKKNDSIIENIKIINYSPRKQLLQKSNSFFSKKIVKKIYTKKSCNNFDISYKSLSRKKIPEKTSPHLSQKNRIIKIDLSKL